MKMNIKFGMRKQFSIVVMLLFLLLPVSSALSINNVQVSEVSDRYAIVNWQSDIDSSSTVSYGTDESLSSSKSSAVKTTNHSVLISPLNNNTQYFFNASSVNGSDSAIVGPNTFTTTLTDTINPAINVNLPDYVGSTTISITGSSEPNTQIYVYVNGNLSGSGFIVTGSDGSFTLSSIRLTAGSGKVTPNDVKIVAIDPSGNQNEFNKVVNVDKTPPGITFDSPVPSAWGEKSLLIKGNSDEPASMTIYLDGTFQTSFNISSPWQYTVNFDKDKKYALRFYAVDLAGNVFDQTYTITVDTASFPRMTHNLADLNPSYTTVRTVTGKTKPGATVIIFVNNRTSDAAVAVTKEGLTNVPLSFQEAYERISRRASSGSISGNVGQYVTTADENGDFSVEIELQQVIQIKEATQIQTGSTKLTFEAGDAWKNDVEIVAIDAVGRVDTSGNYAIYYTRCGEGGFFDISTPVPDPTILPESLIQQGYGQFILASNIKWGGPTPRDKVVFVEPPRFAVQALSVEDREGKYNLTVGSRAGLLKTPILTFPNSLGVNDNTIYAYINLNPTTHDFGAGVKGLYKPELIFPLIIEMKYTYELPGGLRSGVQIQRKCVPARISVDPKVADLKLFNPRGFIRTTTAALASITKGIDTVLKPVQDAQKVALGLCAVGIITDYGKSFWTKAVCQAHGVQGGDIRTKLQDGSCSISYDGTGAPSCNCDNAGADKDNYEACCRSTISAMKFETKAVNLVCDRIFCPAVPSLPTHATSYSDQIILPRSTTTKITDPLFGVPKSDRGNAGSKCYSPFPAKDSQSDCKFEFQRAWGNVVFFGPAANEYNYAYDVLNSQSRPVTVGGSAFNQVSSITDKVISTVGSPTGFIKNVCTPPPADQPIFIPNGELPKDNKQKGYLIYRQAGVQYVDFGIAETITATQVAQRQQGVTQLKTVSENRYFTPTYEHIKTTQYGCCEKGDAGLDCRRAVTDTQNPADSDKICLPDYVRGQIALFYSNDEVFNPTAGIVASTTSVCLPAINGYLQTYRNLLEEARLCMQEVGVTGKTNAKSCSAFLSSVVCDLVTDAFTCGGKLLSPAVRSSGFKLGPGLGFNPFSAAQEAGQTISQSISNRYGKTGTFKNLISSEGLIHSACSFAFTGDWDLNSISELITQASIPPVESTCVIPTATRRIGPVNPLTGRASYVYTIGAMVAAGSDIQHLSVQLVCSKKNDCTQNPLGECDCAHDSESILNVPIQQSGLLRGEVFDELHTIPVQESKFRYDEVRISYDFTDKDGTTKPITCKTTKLDEQGSIPASCSTLPGIGFRCDIKLGDQGTARFVNQPLTPKNAATGQDRVFTIGDTLNIPMRIEVLSPDTKSPISKFVQVITKDAATGREINSFITELDQGIKDYETLPGFQITKANFGPSYADPITIEPHGSNGVIIPKDSKATITGLSETKAIVTFKAGNKYVCNGIDDSTGGPYILNTRATVDVDYSEGSTISCNGISFRITNVGTISPGTLPEVNQKLPLANYQGTAFTLRYIPPPQGVVGCSSDPQTWLVDVSLLNSETIGGTTKAALGSVVYADGRYQRTDPPVPVKVVCSPIGQAEAGSQDFVVQDFRIAPITIAVGGQLTVTHRVSGPVSITDMNLRLKNDQKSVLFPLNKGVSEETVTITGVSSGTYTAELIVNGQPHGSPLSISLT